MKKKRPKLESIILSEIEYFWYLRHWALPVNRSNPYEKETGISVGVWLKPKKTRELIIDFNFDDYYFDKPDLKMELEPRVIQSINEAIEDGWDPESRGKPYGYLPPAKAKDPNDKKRRTRR